MVDAGRTLRHPEADVRRNVVAFRLGQQTYALPIEPIVQIVEMVAITRIPRVSPAVAGVINYHGQTIPVVDLRHYLSTPEDGRQLDAHIIVAQVNGQVLGLIVDQVVNVLDVPAPGIALPGEILPQGFAEVPLLQGVVKTSEALLPLLNLDHLFLPQQAQALAKAVAALPSLVEISGDDGGGDGGEPQESLAGEQSACEETALPQASASEIGA